MEKERLIAIRRDLHRIPEIGFQEYKTQQYLLNLLNQYPEERIEIETWRTGIFVKVNGTAPEKMLAYRADIDALSIEEQTGL
ncbi:N-acetyldiaminopimelate deacetylase, partial [Bacillus velezensis]